MAEPLMNPYEKMNRDTLCICGQLTGNTIAHIKAAYENPVNAYYFCVTPYQRLWNHCLNIFDY